MSLKPKLRLVLLCGEESGDQLADGLVQQLAQRCDLELVGMFGDRVIKQGYQPWVHLRELSVMGVAEIIRHLPRLLKFRRELKERILAFKPDLVLGIDAPDFCIPLERMLKQQGLKTAHYVSPSVWAWRQGRIHKIKRSIDYMLTLFPFETSIYEQHGIPVKCVGHPLARKIEVGKQGSGRTQLDLKSDDKVLAVLPGSRTQEITTLTRPFLEAAVQLQAQFGYRVIVATMRPEQEAEIQSIAQELGLDCGCVYRDSHTLLDAADLALIASGTATLEALLMATPMVVGYKVSPFSWWLRGLLLKIPYVSLPNILHGSLLVPELLQSDCESEKLVAALIQVEQQREQLLQQFAHIHQQLSLGGDEAAASVVLELVGCE